jgi:hypothetical protein
MGEGGEEDISLRILHCKNVMIIKFDLNDELYSSLLFHVRKSPAFDSYLIKLLVAAGKTKCRFLHSDILPNMEGSLITMLEKRVFRLDCLRHLTANVIF